MNPHVKSAERVEGLVEDYAAAAQLDLTVEEAYTVIGDFICDLLHLVTLEGADWREVVDGAIFHFRTSTLEDPGVFDLYTGTDHANCVMTARTVGISYQEAARRLEVVQIDGLVDKLSERRDAGSV